MPRFRTYECPACEKSFEIFHMSNDEPPPRYCVHCAYDTQAEDAPALTEPLAAPHIARSIGKSVDATYRADEEGSNFRADYAQQVLGLDKEAADSLRIRDMRDNTKPGEAAIVPVVNPVSQFMDAHQGTGGFQAGAANYEAYSEAVRTGPAPNAGLRAQLDVRKHHQQITATGHKGATMSDVPANEILKRGYQPRVRTI
jgi:Zn ribbon nucleic-acid-binding protein